MTDGGTVDYGRLYDEQVAGTYDRDELGLLAGVRALAVAQVRATAMPENAMVLDLGAGTGESLLALRDRFPRGRFIGVDLSERMLAIAREKLELQTFVDNVLNAGAHVEDGTADLVLAHFLTSFVDRPQLFRVARRALRVGGAISVVSTTREALFRLRRVAGGLLGDAAAIDAAAPAPLNDGTMAEELKACGFEVVASDTFTKPISFHTFDECLEWGLRSGFLTQVVDAIGLDRVEAVRPLATGVFPFHDEYMGVAITAVAVDRE
jgi:ubiquinone/menaquinone biosynthesis C-methylase UbiE